MMTTRSGGLIDTNVLVYALDSNSEHYLPSRRIIDAAKSESAYFCLAPQNLAEFYSVVTNGKRVKNPRSTEDAKNVVSYILGLPGILLLSMPSSVVNGWLELLSYKPTNGRRIFDLQLVATMLANGIYRIHTFNAPDFSAFPEIEVVIPS